MYLFDRRYYISQKLYFIHHRQQSARLSTVDKVSTSYQRQIKSILSQSLYREITESSFTDLPTVQNSHLEKILKKKDSLTPLHIFSSTKLKKRHNIQRYLYFFHLLLADLIKILLSRFISTTFTKILIFLRTR